MENRSKSYKSNADLAQSVYKQTRTRYSQFKIGLLMCLLLAGGMAYDIYNQYLWIEFGCNSMNIAIHIVVFLILAALVVLSVFYLLSGGKKELLGQQKECLFLYDDHLMLYYLLSKGKYKVFKNNIYYCDIQNMEYDDNKKRIVIKSDCQIQKAADLTAMKSEDVKMDDKENCTTYIYAKYDEFDEIMQKMEELSLKKIRSDSTLY